MDLFEQYLPAILTALGVLLVLLLTILVFRHFKKRVRGRKGLRLGISEYYELDEARQLVLIRRDDVEHLILIGGAQDLVIESGISLQQPIQGADVKAVLQPLRMAPRPLAPLDKKPVLKQPERLGEAGEIRVKPSHSDPVL